MLTKSPNQIPWRRKKSFYVSFCIGASYRISLGIWCLLYAGFLKQKSWINTKRVFHGSFKKEQKNILCRKKMLMCLKTEYFFCKMSWIKKKKTFQDIKQNNAMMLSQKGYFYCKAFKNRHAFLILL